jgi:hypothetical protein
MNHQYLTDRLPSWYHNDWHCSCGYFGNGRWEGYAWHMETEYLKIHKAAETFANAYRDGSYKATEDAYQALEKVL